MFGINNGSVPDLDLLMPNWAKEKVGNTLTGIFCGEFNLANKY